jgi:D-aspartate ligase
MKELRIPAIVFGGGINALGVVRNLGRYGIPVYCVVERKKSAVYSRFCKKYFVVPHIQENTSVLRKFLSDNEKLDCGILFATGELGALHLSELKEELGNNYCVLLPKHEVVRTLADKREFYHSLSELGVPHPLTIFPESPQDVRRISKKLKYPVFIKPCMSHEFWPKFGTKGFIANSRDELLRYYLLALEHRVDVILQEIIPGPDAKNIYGIEGYFDKNSEPKAVYAHCRLRGSPPAFGSTCLRESILIKDAIIPYTKTVTYLKHLGYHGLMEAEWKKDPRDSAFKLLEINVRQSMQNSLPARCGINFILLAYLDAIGEKTKYFDNYDVGVKWINFFDDLASAMKSRISVVEWFSSLKNVREWSYFSGDDLLPWIADSLPTIKRKAFMTAKEIIRRF